MVERYESVRSSPLARLVEHCTKREAGPTGLREGTLASVWWTTARRGRDNVVGGAR